VQISLSRAGQGLDDILHRRFTMQNLRLPAETRIGTMFHAMIAGILHWQGFEENLQQFLIRPIFFNSFPQLLHSVGSGTARAGHRPAARSAI